MNKTALITGVTGMDGSILSRLLLAKGYTVYGISRRTANHNLQRIQDLMTNENFHLLYGDVTDQSSIINAIETANPDHFYNLAAQSFVGESWNQPILTSNVVSMGTLNCLEAIRILNKKIKFYQASSSEMFGKVREVPQTEQTPFYPRSPYGVAKCFGYNMTVNYRESYGMFASNGILFNHESPTRGEEFVTRKITKAIAKIYYDRKQTITLGNLDAKRDWGHAQDYCRAMIMMLECDEPDDYVVATGETHSVRDFLQVAFECIDEPNWERFVKQDAKFMRPAEVDLLVGDSTKIRQKLGWQPEFTFKQLVEQMVNSDITTEAIARFSS